LNEEWLPRNAEMPLGTKLMDAYFHTIPEVQRRSVGVLQQLEAKMSSDLNP
jgi:hypothetical protein